MSEQYSVTSAGVTPAEDRARRMRMYFIAMSLRVVCIASLFWVRGWWILLAAAGSVILPWFAVLVANAVDHSGDGAQSIGEGDQQLIDALTSAGADGDGALVAGEQVGDQGRVIDQRRAVAAGRAAMAELLAQLAGLRGGNP